jgi:hypothetical protein
VKSLSGSSNAKMILLPADLPATVRGVLGALGK